MKTLRKITSLIAAAVIGLTLATAPAVARTHQDNAPAAVLSFATQSTALIAHVAQPLLTAPLAVAAHVPVFLAQVTAPATDTGTTVTATPWYMSGEFFAALIALITSAVAIWQNKEKRTAQKVSETLVVAIEQASKIPSVADKEKQIKAKIKQVTTDAGVEPVVNKLVGLLT